jgi:hypothetical protein
MCYNEPLQADTHGMGATTCNELPPALSSPHVFGGEPVNKMILRKPSKHREFIRRRSCSEFNWNLQIILVLPIIKLISLPLVIMGATFKRDQHNAYG